MHLSFDRDVDIHIDTKIKVRGASVAGSPLSVELTTKTGGIVMKHKGAQKIMYILPADKQVELQIRYVDGNGNPATVDGEVTWTSSNEAVATVVPVQVPPADPTLPPGGVVTLIPGASIGVCQITVRADAELDPGEVRDILTLLDVEVVGGEAVAGTITPGTPVDKT